MNINFGDSYFIGLIFFVFFLIIFTLDVYEIRKTLRFLDNAYETTGTIVSLETKIEVSDIKEPTGEFLEEKKIGEENVLLSRYNISYVDMKGVHHVGSNDIWDSDPKYKTGDIVAIITNPNNPDKIRINSFYSIWFSVVALSILSFLFLLGTIFFYFFEPYL